MRGNDDMDEGGIQRRKSRKKGSIIKVYCVRVGGSALRGFGRCLFVSCYPLLQCFGLDDCRHRHHHHTHFH
ncbi:hypothetical protein ES332_A05G452900v1 [Gossypium tomentosum]|uniref:Uncharacterized protein n=1 Tax=Gossypium tomentosum TaxID=34277 RepID=A0A5D2QS40_GOSTO|nr:hypothetical protein ES332_A05G452900v1 [Gossypium tomentosum]